MSLTLTREQARNYYSAISAQDPDGSDIRPSEEAYDIFDNRIIADYGREIFDLYISGKLARIANPNRTNV